MSEDNEPRRLGPSDFDPTADSKTAESTPTMPTDTPSLTARAIGAGEDVEPSLTVRLANFDGSDNHVWFCVETTPPATGQRSGSAARKHERSPTTSPGWQTIAPALFRG